MSDRMAGDEMGDADMKTLINAAILVAVVSGLALLGMAMTHAPQSQGMTVVATVKLN